MFFPYGTDAPIYFWPFTTAAMIAINIIVGIMQATQDGLTDAIVLKTGCGLHPFQWLTTNFAHAGPVHLLGNMIFLWSFGLIVEGKLGWIKTLILYLGIGIVYGAAVQVLMLNGPEHQVLGASAVAYGFMAMSLIWAPENSIQCIFVLGLYYYKQFELSVKVFVGIFIALQVVELVVTRMSLSSAFLHAIGAGLGFAVGIWMVKTKRVDCENWDIFSIRAGRNRMTEEERNEELIESPEYKHWQEERTTKRTTEALEWIRRQIAEGNAKAALEVYRRIAIEMPQWHLPPAELRNLIIALRKAGLTADAIPLMAEYLAHYAEHAAAVRVALAEALMIQQRPAQALKVLGKLSDAALDARQRQAVAVLQDRAKKLHEDDPYEVADEDW